MKSEYEFIFPENLQEIIKVEGIWVEDSFDPVFITVLEAEYKNQEIMVYELSFSPEDLEYLCEILEDSGLDSDGYAWEALLVNYIRWKQPELGNKVNTDSESETCVLWVEDQDDFKQILSIALDLLHDRESLVSAVNNLIRSN